MRLSTINWKELTKLRKSSIKYNESLCLFTDLILDLNDVKKPFFKHIYKTSQFAEIRVGGNSNVNINHAQTTKNFWKCTQSRIIKFFIIIPPLTPSLSPPLSHTHMHTHTHTHAHTHTHTHTHIH